MAYQFIGSSSQYISSPVTSLAAPAITISAWFYQSSLSTGIIASASPANGSYVGIASLSTGPVRFVTPFRDVDTTINAATNKWNHAVGVLASTTSRTVYLNGDSNTDTASGGSVSSLDILIGARRLNGALGTYYTGFIAEVGVWNVALTDSDVAALAAGVPNDRVRPESLVFNAPLVRDIRDIQSHLVLTNNNGVTIAQDHPQIYRPQPKKRFFRGYTFSPPTPTDYRTVRVKQTEHASLREGLVGAWCPSVAGEGYTLPDLSGQGNNGTLTNMGPEDWVSGQYGRALDFDGVNDKVSVVRLKNYESSVFSASCWINLNATTEATNRMIFGSLAYDGVAYTGGWNIGKRRSNATDGNANKLYWIYVTQTTTKASYTISVAPVNKFIHAAIIYNGSFFAGYLDGVQQFVDTDTFKPNTERNLSFGGNDSNNFDLHHSGQLDDVRIYNRALSESEIKLLASRPGIGLKNDRKVFDFNRQTTYVPKVSPYFRTIKANKTEHASLREGLVGAWIPSVAGDGLMLPDLSGQGNNGALTNMGPEDWVSGQYGRALDFDGVDDYTNCGNILNSTFAGSEAKFTICAWLNTTVNTNQIFISKVDGTLNQRQFFLRANDDGLDFTWYGTLALPATFRVVRAPLVFSSAGWVPVAVTFDATISNADQKASLYLYGSQQSISIVSTSGNPTAIQAGTAPLSFGCFFNNSIPVGLFTGQLDDVRIYNRALSESEIKLLASKPGIGFKSRPKTFDFGKQPVLVAPEVAPDYRSVRVKQTEHSSLREGLVGAWCPSVAGEGYTLPDLSGRGNNGTLTNMGPEDWVSSQYGRALDFDGVNDYVTLTPFNLKTYCPTVGCILIWVYPRTTSRNAFLADWNAAGGSETFRLEMSGFGITSGRIGGTFLASGGAATVQTSATVTLNTWHLIAVQRTSSGQELFWNGVLDSFNSIPPTSVPAAALPIVLGRGGSFNSLYSNAQVAEVALWNRPLTRSEHIEIYRLGPGIGLRPQRHTEYYAPPNRKRNNLLGNLF